MLHLRASRQFRRRAVLWVVVTALATSLATWGTAAGSSASSASTAARRAVGIGLGPAGGYNPADLAVAYGYTPTIKRSSQVVAVVSWYDDPHLRADVVAFDHEYGLPTETTSSLRVVNQAGAKSPLPSSAHGRSTAQQTATQVETVRGVCNTCRLLVVEATSGSVKNVATAEKTAGRLGASEIVNALATPETKQPASVRKAFEQPGVVIAAPAGDRGWFGMDAAFATKSPGKPSFPATDPWVVAVGGTTLGLFNNATIDDQLVWNADGEEGANTAGVGLGATGGGCSRLYPARPWQRGLAGYTSADCAGKRLAADVSADADPQTGLDVYDSWGHTGSPWLTAGGDDLATAIVGGMWALAGGAAGAEFPAAAVYENATRHPTDAFDVVEGGNGFCGGDTTFNCGSETGQLSATGNHNPNALGGGIIDCSFSRNGTDPALPPALSSECNAVPGYDGPSGVGTPLNAGLFAPTNPAVKVTHGVVRAGKPTTFRLDVRPRLTGTKITQLTVQWGDGHSTSGNSSARKHTYRKSGRVQVVVIAIDSLGQGTRIQTSVTIKKAG